MVTNLYHKNFSTVTNTRNYIDSDVYSIDFNSKLLAILLKANLFTFPAFKNEKYCDYTHSLYHDGDY